MDILKRLADSIVVPVVVLDKVEDAIPTAKAMAAGGIDTMEITFRTACAPECIKAVADNCPEVLVGAGTIVNLEQAKLAVEMGAKFIVSPGFIEEVVGWCVENGIAVAPGCVTPSEIMAAKKFGLKMVKFFPANVYGGLTALKNLAAPFGDMKFLPTGGINADNVGEFIAAPFIHAVGGSWVCPKADIAAGNWEKITQLSAEATHNIVFPRSDERTFLGGFNNGHFKETGRLHRGSCCGSGEGRRCHPHRKGHGCRRHRHHGDHLPHRLRA